MSVGELEWCRKYEANMYLNLWFSMQLVSVSITDKHNSSQFLLEAGRIALTCDKTKNSLLLAKPVLAVTHLAAVTCWPLMASVSPMPERDTMNFQWDIKGFFIPCQINTFIQPMNPQSCSSFLGAAAPVCQPLGEKELTALRDGCNGVHSQASYSPMVSGKLCLRLSNVPFWDYS